MITKTEADKMIDLMVKYIVKKTGCEAVSDCTEEESDDCEMSDEKRRECVMETFHDRAVKEAQ